MIMGQRAKKLPIASAGNAPVIEITDDNWRRIEHAYRRELSPAVRKQIHKITQTFAAEAQLECRAEPAAATRTRIEAIKAAASLLHRELHTGTTTADTYARTLIKRQLANDHPPKHKVSDFDAEIDDSDTGIFEAAMRWDPPTIHDDLRVISEHAVSLVFACQAALSELKAGPSFRKGEAWCKWVRRLTDIAKKNDLPWGASQETTNQSQFVNFIRKLQCCCVPDEYWHTNHSYGAMAKAITRAREAGQ